MQNTASDRFGQTDYNMSDNNERNGGLDHQQYEQQQDLQQMGQNDEEPQKMFSFDDQKVNAVGARQQL